MNFSTGYELLERAKEIGSLSETILRYELAHSQKTKEEILAKLTMSWEIMKTSVYKGYDDDYAPKGYMIGGEAKKLKQRYEKGHAICGPLMAKAVSYGLSTMEVNVSMGKIVACPTAGSSGVLPGVLLTLQETYELSDEIIIKGLLVASGIGIIIGKRASLSGAQGGCQAEVGSASAMAAGAIVHIMGGTDEAVLSAAAMALKNLMGLICDPVAGLVEVPCQKRNGIGIANALITAEMALAGINSKIPFDEVVDAMDEVSKMMPSKLRETSEGGIAITPTAKAYEKAIFDKGE